MSELQYTITIKELPEEDRPRERLQQYGPSSLSNSELVAILLGGGFRNVSALSLAQLLLQENGGLKELSHAHLEKLTVQKGVGIAKACCLVAAFELGRRAARSSGHERPSIKTPEDAAALLMPKYGNLEKETVGVLILDTKNKVIKDEVVSIGILDGSMVHPREVYRSAVISNAAGIILFHNHPSGDPTPSEKDIAVTRRISEAGKIMGLELLDHIIVARDRFVSLKSQKLM